MLEPIEITVQFCALELKDENCKLIEYIIFECMKTNKWIMRWIESLSIVTSFKLNYYINVRQNIIYLWK